MVGSLGKVNKNFQVPDTTIHDRVLCNLTQKQLWWVSYLYLPNMKRPCQWNISRIWPILVKERPSLSCDAVVHSYFTLFCFPKTANVTRTMDPLNGCTISSVTSSWERWVQQLQGTMCESWLQKSILKLFPWSISSLVLGIWGTSPLDPEVIAKDYLGTSWIIPAVILQRVGLQLRVPSGFWWYGWEWRHWRLCLMCWLRKREEIKEGKMWSCEEAKENHKLNCWGNGYQY